MTLHVLRRVLLLGALVLTIPLPVVYGWRTLGVAVGVDGSGDESFITGLGLFALANAAVGVTILWRRPGNRVGILLTIGALMLTSVVAAWPWLYEVAPGQEGPLVTFLAWWSPIGLLPALFVLFPSVVLVFPDGHLLSRRWAQLYGLFAVILVAGIAIDSLAAWPVDPAAGIFGNPFALEGVPPEVRVIGETLMLIAVLGGFALAIASVFLRFRRSTGMERAQIKWLAAAVALNGILFPLSYLTELQPDQLLDVVSVAAGIAIPVAIGIAVMRYHLYDIDRIISRTVSWAIVTGAIVATFAALVVGLQTALDHVTQGETLAVALSTLVVAALFQPIRRGVQRTVDRRFHRSHYDATQTALDLMAHLRDDVDLGHLAGDVLRAVDTTLHPVSRSLWLRVRASETSGAESTVTISGHVLPNVTPT